MQVEIQRTNADKVSVLLEGPLDRQTVPKIRKKLLSSAKKSGVRKMEIDLSRVSSMDTAGIAMMVEVLRVLASRNGKLGLTGLNENAIKMVRLSRLDKVFDMQNRPAIGS